MSIPTSIVPVGYKLWETGGSTAGVFPLQTHTVVLSFPADEHRAYPRAFDCGAGQAESGDRSPGNTREAPWQAAEESAGRRDGSARENRLEAQRPESRQAESPIRADE